MKEHVMAEVAEMVPQRAAFYRLLASLYFKEVSDEFIATLQQLPASLVEEEGRLGQGFSKLRSYFVRKGPDPRTDLACDYARVFLAAGMFTGDAACPFESIYTSEEKLIMQDARDEVRAIYLAHSVNVDESLHLPEDHLSFELEFLAILSDRAEQLAREGDAEAVASNLEAQRNFIDDHLLNWLDALSDQVSALARHAFYPAIMDVTVGYLEHDRALLDDLAKELSVFVEF